MLVHLPSNFPRAAAQRSLCTQRRLELPRGYKRVRDRVLPMVSHRLLTDMGLHSYSPKRPKSDSFKSLPTCGAHLPTVGADPMHLFLLRIRSWEVAGRTS